jgi:Fe-S-cluster-containing hydrogenase component 2/thioredoxin reductase/bacterioferritin-associated ferredoxin
MLAAELAKQRKVEIWTDSTVLYVFKDAKVGILKDGEYVIVTPKRILNAAGAREKFLRFAGNTLAGIYGAGAFQTLVNRDLVRPTQRLFIVGGGNVGLIAGYHALQAGIEVAGLVEAMPVCGGYKVHADKLKRLGVPIHTSHTVISANGGEYVESVTIAQIDDKFKPTPGTEKTYACDTLLIAVGLNSIDEFTREAKVAGIPVYAAGDAMEIAEASSAMFNGKITGLEIARDFGANVAEIPPAWIAKAEVLKSHPGAVTPEVFSSETTGVMPVIHCVQVIPCNPCTTVCPTHSIRIEGDPILDLPGYTGGCIGCFKCVSICPGLAITLVDYRKSPDNPIVTVPYEVMNHHVTKGDTVRAVNIDGDPIGAYMVLNVIPVKDKRMELIQIQATDSIPEPLETAKKVVSFRIQDSSVSYPMSHPVISEKTADDAMACLCERVTVGQIRELVRQGVTDLNQIKALTRSGMGPCGSKTCDLIVKQVLREEGIPVANATPNTLRPVFIEVPLGVFAGVKGGDHA